MANINRDYFLQVDAKSSSIVSNNNMTFYITDKNTANFFIKLVVNMSDNENISNYVSIEEASNYSIELNIIKPNNELKTIIGTLLNEQEALYLFNLPLDYTDQQGTYKCELFVKCIVNEQEEIVTSNEFTYTVKKSIINDLDEVIETDSDYPILLDLIKKVEGMNTTDVSTLATIKYVDEKVASIDISDIDLSSYATKTELASKVDKVVGKSLIADTEITRLAGIVNYTHPVNHPASVITQDSNNRFVTDTEKTSWNAKSNFDGNYNNLTNKPTIPTVTNDLTSALKSNYDTAYTHSQSTHAPVTAQKNSDITKAEIEAKLTGSITSHNHNYANTTHTHIKSDITDFSHIHSYNELTDKPTIPTNLSEFTNDSNFTTQSYVDTKVSEINTGSSSNVNLDNYCTKLETDTKIQTLNQEIVRLKEKTISLDPFGDYEWKFEISQKTTSSDIDVSNTIFQQEAYDNPELLDQNLSLGKYELYAVRTVGSREYENYYNTLIPLESDQITQIRGGELSKVSSSLLNAKWNFDFDSIISLDVIPTTKLVFVIIKRF